MSYVMLSAGRKPSDVEVDDEENGVESGFSQLSLLASGSHSDLSQPKLQAYYLCVVDEPSTDDVNTDWRHEQQLLNDYMQQERLDDLNALRSGLISLY